MHDSCVLATDPITGSYTGPVKSTRAIVLEQASTCVLKDRQATHGKPENTFEHHAMLWTAYLRSRLSITAEISSVDVANMMILFKVGRNIANPGNLDNYVDIAGYAACGAEVSDAH